jgi:hypothetical protein
MRAKSILAFAWIFLVISLSGISSAQVLGVSPANIDFSKVMRGGYAERQIAITMNSETPTEVRLETRGEAGEWISFPDNLFQVSRNSPGIVVVSVEPPEDMPNGNYSAFIRVRLVPSSSGSQEGHATITSQTVVDIAVNVEITDIEFLSCSARGFSIESVEKGDDLVLSMEFMNLGNIRMRPSVRVEIWDQEYTRAVKNLELSGESVLPTRREKATFRIPTNDMDIDQYWMNVESVECLSSDSLTFDIYEPGTLRADGMITGIFGKAWAEVGETVPILISFKNTGQKSVLAQFRGQITLNGRIVQLLESERIDVPVSEMTDFTFYFTPEKEGNYVVAGRVFYDRKRTFESSTVINAVAASKFWKHAMTYAAYAAMVSLAVFLIHKITREKKRRMR